MNMGSLSPEGKERYKSIICEELWLKYYNSTLLKHGIITDREYMRMNIRISQRTCAMLEKLKCLGRDQSE